MFAIGLSKRKCSKNMKPNQKELANVALTFLKKLKAICKPPVKSYENICCHKLYHLHPRYCLNCDQQKQRAKKIVKAAVNYGKIVGIIKYYGRNHFEILPQVQETKNVTTVASCICGTKLYSKASLKNPKQRKPIGLTKMVVNNQKQLTNSDSDNYSISSNSLSRKKNEDLRKLHTRKCYTHRYNLRSQVSHPSYHKSRLSEFMKRFVKT